MAELEPEWPFRTNELGDVRLEPGEEPGGRNREEGIYSYLPPSTIWEGLDLSSGGAGSNEHALPADAQGLGGVMGALDVQGACVLRGDAATAAACAELARALGGAASGEAVVKGVAQRFAESHPLVAHAAHLKLCAGALGRQLLRVASLEELGARMSLPSTFTDGETFKQLPFELDYARASRPQPAPLRRPHLGADFVPAAQDLENQLTCFWALDGAAVVRYAPGSHRWPLGRAADSSAATEVVLQPGDSLVCASGLWRGAGQADRAPPALVLEVGYHLSFWQTEEENQMAIGSPRAALSLPSHIQRLCGWCKPGDILNKQYSGGPRADPLGAAEFLGERPLDWGGQVWTAETVDATPDSLAVAADGWCGPQEFCESIAWSEYPSRFGELALPPSDPSALTSIEWPGSGASPEAVAATVEQCLGVIERDGAVILAHAVQHDTIDAFMHSLEPYNQEGDAADGDGPAECGSVLARSTASLPLAAHPCVMGVCEGVLGRQVLTMDATELQRRLRLAGCEDEERIPWQLQVQAFIGKPPHQRPQLLHRDGEYLMVQLPGEQIEHEISVIWATHDFTNALGATRAVKGSHRWPRQRSPLVSEAVGAEMPKGSCVMYGECRNGRLGPLTVAATLTRPLLRTAGHTLHGAGENTTDDWRIAMNFDYIPRFIKAECHMALEIPPTIARFMPETVLELAGYRGREEVEEACWLRAECDRALAKDSASSKL